MVITEERMKRNDFGLLLKRRKWKTLIDASSSLFVPDGHDDDDGHGHGHGHGHDDGHGSSTTDTTATFCKQPTRVDPTHVLPVMKIVLPDILATLVSPENHDQPLDARRRLVEMLPRDFPTQDIEAMLQALQQVVQAMDKIHVLLDPNGNPLARAQLVEVLPPPPPSVLYDQLQHKLDQVVDVVLTFATNEGVRSYLQTQPQHARGANIHNFQQASFKLCWQAVSPKHAQWSVDRLHDKMIHALEVSGQLVNEISKCHGFLNDLSTMALHESQGTRTGGFPPLLASFVKRALLNFRQECLKCLTKTCPGAVDVICGDSFLETGLLPPLDRFRVDNMVKHQGIILDMWTGKADLIPISKDLVVLADIFHDFAKNPPFSLFVKHTRVSDLLERILQTVAPERRFVHTVTSGKVLANANRVGNFHPPMKSLTQVYKRLIKRRVMDAVLVKKKFDLDATLRYFQEFYHEIRPPVFNSGILAMRVYQVYRDVCILLGLPMDVPLPEKSFFQDISETLVPDPFCWVSPPLASRQVAEIVAACRDLILSYTQSPELSPTWVERLATCLCGEPSYTKQQMVVEYGRIQTLFATKFLQSRNETTDLTLE
jgi:hypothetical protein